MPVFNARNPLEYLLGAGELGLSGVTNLASMVGSVPYSIYKQMESGEYGQNTDAFDKYSKQTPVTLSCSPAMKACSVFLSEMRFQFPEVGYNPQ